MTETERHHSIGNGGADERREVMKRDDVNKEEDGCEEHVDEGHWSLSMGCARHQDLLQSCCDPLAVFDDDECVGEELGRNTEPIDTHGNRVGETVDGTEHVEWHCEACEERVRMRTMWLGRVVVAAIVTVCFFLPDILGLTP